MLIVSNRYIKHVKFIFFTLKFIFQFYHRELLFKMYHLLCFWKNETYFKEKYDFYFIYKRIPLSYGYTFILQLDLKAILSTAIFLFLKLYIHIRKYIINQTVSTQYHIQPKYISLQTYIFKKQSHIQIWKKTNKELLNLSP